MVKAIGIDIQHIQRLICDFFCNISIRLHFSKIPDTA